MDGKKYLGFSPAKGDKRYSKTTIYVCNLGNFDGYFIFKYASIIYDIHQVQSIIDAQNKFIMISFTSYATQEAANKLKFIDSARIFSVSLNSLCDVFNQGEGKNQRIQF